MEEFDEFTESSDSPKYSDWLDDNDGDIEDYLEHFPHLKDGWEEWIDKQVEYMIDNYPSLDEINPYMGLLDFEVVWEYE